MHVRPSDPDQEHFDDIRGSLSVSRSGVFFHTSEGKYQVGMRLFVTMPYTKDPSAMSREYLVEVVRCDPQRNGLTGIGFKILMEMTLQGGYSLGRALQRK